MLQFDEHGHLAPCEITELTLPEFEAVFVDGLRDQTHRRALFEDYLLFVDAVKKSFGVPFHQWIAGSFVTMKEFSGDIDTVTFLPHDLMMRKMERVQYFKVFGQETYRVDASFSPVCKWNHRFFETARIWEADYFNLYSLSRPDENLIKHPKGIVKLNFLP